MDLTPMFSPVQHLGEYIREQRTAAQISLRSLAAKAGVSNPYLSQVERGLRRPSAGVLAQIAQGLQISTESLLVRAGILSPSEANAVVDAIRADQHLTDHHKSVLIEIYTAFRRESGNPPDGSTEPAAPADGTAPAEGTPLPDGTGLQVGADVQHVADVRAGTRGGAARDGVGGRDEIVERDDTDGTEGRDQVAERPPAPEPRRPAQPTAPDRARHGRPRHSTAK